jgi:hypothetical protein
MTDVRLTALNPVDSQVYPVACNTSGELLVADGGPDLTVTGDLTVDGTTRIPTGDLFIGGLSAETADIALNANGSATFEADATINGLTIGRGSGNVNGNIANGFQALYNNTTGYQNIAIGLQTLFSNTIAFNNTATGHQALYANTAGNNNVANGYNALVFNTTGDNNVAIGYQALVANTTGRDNVANGYRALFSNSTGSGNTAIGEDALVGCTSGSYNATLGQNALRDVSTGSGNIGIGTTNSNGANDPVFNPTTHDNRLVLGHTSITNAYVKVSWTVTSDERDKMNFAPVPYGLDFVNQLKPTAYQFKVDRDTETPNGAVRFGFKAQDILALEGDNPVIIDTEDPDHLKYKGESLVPVLVNASGS